MKRTAKRERKSQKRSVRRPVRRTVRRSVKRSTRRSARRTSKRNKRSQHKGGSAIAKKYRNRQNERIKSNTMKKKREIAQLLEKIKLLDPLILKPDDHGLDYDDVAHTALQIKQTQMRKRVDEIRANPSLSFKDELLGQSSDVAGAVAEATAEAIEATTLRLKRGGLQCGAAVAMAAEMGARAALRSAESTRRAALSRIAAMQDPQPTISIEDRPQLPQPPQPPQPPQ